MKVAITVVLLLSITCLVFGAGRNSLKQQLGALQEATTSTRDAVDDTFDSCVTTGMTLTDQQLYAFSHYVLSSAEKTLLNEALQIRKFSHIPSAWKPYLHKLYCYQVCYVKAMTSADKKKYTGNRISTYDATTYKSEGIKALTELFKLKTGDSKQLYTAFDWNHSPITDAITDDNSKTGFIFLTTPAHEASTDATSANTIRVTLQIKLSDAGATRATNLFSVLQTVVSATKPEWLKFDTPDGVREDSIILSYKAADKEKKQAALKAVCDIVSSDQVKGNLSTSLPPYQFKKDCPLASVADYYYGNSFGTVLCNRKVKNGASFASSWTTAKHPTTDAWDFSDPTDITQQEGFLT